ncbi:DUF3011 family protein [Luteibacter rhizovicinus]|uniref:DUF3011 family protein n=1 Tax=Luteibacter rhizovicinus TaxID=242606 RepID=A0A4V2W3Z6_9GAMM|nr:DUF3011 domain-containing protein [Luteibacter rhizovicinus]TCV93919.1 DUF3011 family protein [Luteibacter rhizovicinus]
MRGFVGMVAIAAVAFVVGAGVGVPVTAHAQGYGPIHCDSNGGRFTRCDVPWRDAELVRQDSNAPCERGRSWGMDRQGLWVDKGCRGQFVPARGRPGWGDDDGRPGWGGGRPDDDDDRPGWGGGRPDDGYGRPGGWGRERIVDCDSNNSRYNRCNIDVGRGGVRLIKRKSDARCNEGEGWGWDGRGIWVDRGCRAQFSVDVR